MSGWTFADAIDDGPLAGRRIAIIGYGNQGRAQALNLKDGGHDVVIGLRDGSPRAARAQGDGLACADPVAAAAGADLVMLLAPDEHHAALYRAIEPALKPNAALGFSHGLAIHFGQLVPRADLDIFLLAPKGPGSALRDLFVAGKGMPALWAVAQDGSGNARAIALAYGAAIGCARAGLIASSFAEECVADLFNEQAVVWGAVPAILAAGFETLVEAGVSEEVAYLECVGELKLLAELVDTRGIAGMRAAISRAAALGAARGGPATDTPALRAHMADVLSSIRAGEFARDLMAEAEAGYPTLTALEMVERSSRLEQVRRRLERED